MKNWMYILIGIVLLAVIIYAIKSYNERKEIEAQNQAVKIGSDNLSSGLLSRGGLAGILNGFKLSAV